MKEITKRTVIRRINRHLAHDHSVLKTTRVTSKLRKALGEYYIIAWTGHPGRKHIDLEAYAREIGCLAEDEVLTDE